MPALRDPKFDEIKALPVATIAARDCHLFFWTTGPHLPQALTVLCAWGFRYSGIAFTWIKLKRNTDLGELIPLGQVDASLHLGLGYTTRKNTEVCLLGRRGSPNETPRISGRRSSRRCVSTAENQMNSIRASSATPTVRASISSPANCAKVGPPMATRSRSFHLNSRPAPQRPAAMGTPRRPPSAR